MLELFKSSFIISLFTSIFVVIGIKLINLFTEKKSDKNNDKDDFDKEESSDNSYTSDYSYMNGNIIDGYYNLMYLLPDIFKKVNTIDDIMIAFYDVVSNMDKYNQYVEKSSRTPEEDAGELSFIVNSFSIDDSYRLVLHPVLCVARLRLELIQRRFMGAGTTFPA